MLDRLLVKLHAGGHRVLLFSTMTKLLDLLEEYLRWRVIGEGGQRMGYLRIDGSTSLEDRCAHQKAAVSGEAGCCTLAGTEQVAVSALTCVLRSAATCIVSMRHSAGVASFGSSHQGGRELAASPGAGISCMLGAKIGLKDKRTASHNAAAVEDGAQLCRESNIQKFNSPNSPAFIFLLSIRAAGRGLNLQSADTVIIYDPDANPKNEEQVSPLLHISELTTQPIASFRYHADGDSHRWHQSVASIGRMWLLCLVTEGEHCRLLLRGVHHSSLSCTVQSAWE